MLLINIFAELINEKYVKPFSNYHCGGRARQKTGGVRMECIYTKQ